MPTRDDGDEAADLVRDSGQLVEEGRRLRSLSDRLIAEIDTLKHLELEARRAGVGSPEFERLSREMTRRARGVFEMSVEQADLAVAVEPQEMTVEDVDPRQD